MRESQPSGPIHPGVGALILLLAGVVATTPLLLALAAVRVSSAPSARLTVAAAVLWSIAFALYRGLVLTRQHRRRSLLRNELAETRRARLEASDVFQDRLYDHHAVLDRVAELSEELLADGITDPQQALRHIGLIAGHARDAQTQIEDSIIEVRVETGEHKRTIETINARDEIEHVAAPFARRGVDISTSGPRHFARTDPAMFRLIVRSLIAAAVDREATDIDVSIARNGDTVVCTVSDAGSDCSRLGLETVSALAKSLADYAGADLRFLRALGRNQFSIETDASEVPAATKAEAAPMDVLGELPPSVLRIDAEKPPRQIYIQQELVTFLEDHERDRRHSVAYRKGRELLPR